jgi:hypothetical protein
VRPGPLPGLAAAPDGQSAPVEAVTDEGRHCEDRSQRLASLQPALLSDLALRAHPGQPWYAANLSALCEQCHGQASKE